LTVIDGKNFPFFEPIMESFGEKQTEIGLTEFSGVWAYTPHVLDLVHESLAGLEFDDCLKLCEGFGIDQDTLLREAIRLAHTMGEDATD
jgi:hypothetical protein